MRVCLFSADWNSKLSLFAAATLLSASAVAGTEHASCSHKHDHSNHEVRPIQTDPMLVYTINEGQWEDQVKFKAVVPFGAVYIEEQAITFSFVSEGDLDHIHDLKHETRDPELVYNSKVRGHAWRLNLVGASSSVVQGENKFSHHYNYFVGDDQSKWRGGVSNYQKVRQADIYPGTDLLLTSEGNAFKYEFHLAAGADPSVIQMRYDGIEPVLAQDKIYLQTAFEEFVEQSPIAWQLDAQGNKIPVACNYKLDAQKLSFEFPEGLDPTMELVIDPTLRGSSYCGQVGSSQYGFTACFDDAGNMYGAGESFGSGFPATMGAFDVTFGGGVDMGITKFNEDGSLVYYATYLGGSSTDLPHSMIVDGSDELIILGSTLSSNFPTTTGTYDPTYNGGTDITVSRLSIDGSTLLGSTYLGGNLDEGVNPFTLAPNYGDRNRGEINLDAAGNIYVASSSNSSNFPTTAGAFQTTKSGLNDAVVFRMIPDLTILDWATFLGGTSDDATMSVKVKSTGEVVVSGGTTSPNYPTTPGVLSATGFGGTSDGMLSMLSNDGSTLIQSTYIGSTGADIAFWCDVDEDDNVYVAGNCGPGFPITGAVYNNPNSTQFVAKMSASFVTYLWSTQIGAGTGGGLFGGNELAPTAFLVDNCGNIYIGGFTDENLPVTADAFQLTEAGGGDFHFTVLAPDAAYLLYGTYIGGSGWEHVDGGTSRYDKRGVLYQASCTSSNDFPMLASPAYGTSSISWDRVTFKFDFEFAEVLSVIGNAAFGGDTLVKGCVPLELDFINESIGADTYSWDFGDGGSSTLFEPTYTYVDTGTFTVQLIAALADSLSTCGDADTAYMTIIVHQDSVLAQFDVDPDCDALTADFEFTGINFDATVWDWSFGDGNVSNVINPTHTYGSTGTYPVTLIVTDSATCNISDTALIDVPMYPELVAGFTHPLESCPPFTVDFVNSTTGPSQFYDWDFGTGDGSIDQDPTYIYNDPGSYTVTLITYDTLSCNLYDTVTSTVLVYDEPIPEFDFFPTVPFTFDPVNFLDGSTDAVFWEWNFGDGSSPSFDQNPTHQFEESGTFEVCLIATSIDGCRDTLCQEILVDAEITMPNAFTPNQDGLNDIFAPVFHQGINGYYLVIFNRWGEMIFQSNDPNEGWDGTYRGKESELGTYIWTLVYVNEEGTKVRRNGSLNLIR